MKIVTNLDFLMLKKRIKSKDLAAAIGITEQGLSTLKTGKTAGIRFSTLAALCKQLECQPGDILLFQDDN